MNLILKRFSQDVDLSDPDKIGYYLVFSTEDGQELRLPVLQETTETLVKFLYAQKEISKVEDAVEEVEEGDSESSMKEEEYDEEPEEEDTSIYSSSFEEVPASEEDVPSL